MLVMWKIEIIMIIDHKILDLIIKILEYIRRRKIIRWEK
jgi:hypothetical protein